MTHRPAMKRASGFSLIEMAVVLFIVVLLLGGLLVPFATQVEQRRIAETQKTLEEIKEALIGYALSHSSTSAATPTQPFLPCPDADNNGEEDARNAAGNCLAAEGNLPWATLGTAPTDAWGNRFHYRVSNAFSNSSTGFGLASAGDLRVCDLAPTAAASIVCPAGPPSHTVASQVPAVVLSYGKNGFGARNAGGNINQAPASADERENTPAGLSPTIIVMRTLTGANTPAGEFDDLVTWLSPNILFNRMVAAQRLP